MDGSETGVGETNAEEGYRWANTFIKFVIISVWFEDSLPSVFVRELFNTMDGEHVDEEKVDHLYLWFIITFREESQWFAKNTLDFP